MRKCALLIVLVSIMSLSLQAQYRAAAKKTSHTEFGLFRGYATYYGDLANSGEFVNMTDKGSAIGAFLRFNFDSYYSMRLSYTTGRISGSDEDATDAYERERGLNFVNDITEFSLISEVNMLNFNMCRTTALYTPYVFFGAAIYFHNPMIDMNGQLTPLVDKRTEGQNTSPYNGPVDETGERWNDGGAGGHRATYGLTQFSIPIGVGFKYRFYRNSTIAFELGVRKTWFDYLDDVSKTYVATPIDAMGISSSGYADPNQSHAEGDARGTKNGSDYYMFLGITVAFSTANCTKKNPVKCFSFKKWK